MEKLKKGSLLKCIINDTIFPNTGISYIDDQELRVKNTLPGQEVKVRVKKKKKDYYEGLLIDIISPSPLENEDTCKHYFTCGGCSQQSLSYDTQLNYKTEQVKKLFDNSGLKDYHFTGIVPGPDIYEYRNKMEFTFGDLNKDGVLQLGLHPRGKRFDIITVEDCQLVDSDFRKILLTILEYCRINGFNKYHFRERKGFLRHLVIRKGINTGEILVNLVTTSQMNHNFNNLIEKLKGIKYIGLLVGFLQTINDDFADAVKCDYLLTHFGRNFYYEELLGLKFKVTPFSFFQPNTKGAEILYQTVLEFMGDKDKKLVYDLYCGTGTISQIVAEKAGYVIGIELVKEAVEIARENAQINGLNNCEFWAGDVLKKLDNLNKKPDTIIIDPPRPGIHPLALKKIIKLDCSEIIYVSCNPRTLVRDLKELINNGYKLIKVQCVDMFPHTHHIETVTLLRKLHKGNF